MPRLFSKYFFFLLSAFLVLTSCHDSDSPDEPQIIVEPVNRTVLVYMIADNSLGRDGYDSDDLDEMLAGVMSGALNGGRLLVYHNRRGTDGGLAPQMLEVTEKGIEVLITYPDDSSVYSVDVARMRQVINDSRRLAPAADYGLILWSHGSGWKESNSSRSENPVLTLDNPITSTPQVHDFGEDRGQTMKISSLSDALSGFGFSFIYFDCCFMGTVEVMYELRDAAPVIVASGIELPVYGMPYDKNLPVFFADGKPDMVQAARNTFEYYDSRIGIDRTCAMTVVNTAGMARLAEVSRKIFADMSDFPAGLNNIQSYERPGFVKTIYDFSHYIETICTDPDLLAEWNDAMAETVVYADNTPTVFRELNLDRYCGLGSFVIMSNSDITFRNYNKQKWYSDVVSVAPVLKNN